nr:uncharacterized protein LOC106620343 isoform X2 [Bactrocera oleae]XP_036232579.1 uncharacterized protein LOC106620343 isoform X2 [Bactrocera oleae]XP_036232580.1 uncharacterized protein LOC106620343 isoform X2 [Bactrocera oleae]
MMKHLQSSPKINAPSNKDTPSRKIANGGEHDLVIQPKTSTSSLYLNIHQGHLDRCINNATAFAVGRWKHNQVTTALVRMIAIDNMPLSTPGRAGFKALVNKIQPLYLVATRTDIDSSDDSKIPGLI